jgi:hypothetical protein
LRILFYIFFCISLNPICAQNDRIAVASQINMPFELSYRSLEQTVNASVSGVIYKDSSFEDNNNDQLKCIIKKNGTISIQSVKQNVLKIDVPIKIQIEKGIGSFGIYTYQSTEMELTMSFQMVWNVLPSWKLFTRSIKNGYQWNKKPSINLKGVEIPITAIVERIIDSKQQEYANLIDQQIDKNVNLKKNVIRIWNQLATPTQISVEYNAWMIARPKKILALAFSQNDKSIYTSFGIDLEVETAIGYQPPLMPFVIDIPSLTYTKTLKDEFELYTVMNIPYYEATSIGKKKMIGTEYEFENGKYNIKIEDLNIRGKDSLILIETTLSGSFKGVLRVEGLPYYDSTQNAIRLKNLDYNIQTKNLFYNLANWLLSKKILNSLQDNFAIPTEEGITRAKLSATDALNQTRNGAKFNGMISKMTPTAIRSINDILVMVILTKGQVKATL